MADSAPESQTHAPSGQELNQDDVPPSQQQINDDVPPSQQTPPTAALPPLPQAAETSSRKRSRGRPRGAKNKSKSPIIEVQEEKPNIHHLQLQIPIGAEIVAALESFSREHQTRIIVQSGHGSVTNITLQRQGTPIPGVVDVVSLAGVFFDPFNYFPAYTPGTHVPWLKMLLTPKHTWQISRAYVVDSAVAFTKVLVNIMTFGHLEVHRIDPAKFGDQEPAYPLALNYGGDAEASGSGLGGGMPPPRFVLPGAERRTFTPLPGIGAFRPPNYPKALSIGGDASGSGLPGEMPPPRFLLPDGERRYYTPSAGVSAFRPPNYSNALSIGGGGEASGSGSRGGAEIAEEMPPPGFGPPVEQRNYAPLGGLSAFRPPSFRNAFSIIGSGGGEASGSGSGGGAETDEDMPLPGFGPPVGEQRN